MDNFCTLLTILRTPLQAVLTLCLDVALTVNLVLS